MDRWSLEARSALHEAADELLSLGMVGELLAARHHKILKSAPAFGQITAPPTRASNFSKVQKPAEYGSESIEIAFRTTIKYS